jgi:hypothetical protein
MSSPRSATTFARLFGLERIEMVRYAADGWGTVVAASGDHPFVAGSRWNADDPSVLREVLRTGGPARIDDYSSLGGAIAEEAHRAGFRSAIGAPIVGRRRCLGNDHRHLDRARAHSRRDQSTS